MCSFIESNATEQNTAYLNAVAANYAMGRGGIDGTLKAYALDAFVMPTERASTLPAIAGYPIITGALRTSSKYVDLVLKLAPRSPPGLPAYGD